MSSGVKGIPNYSQHTHGKSRPTTVQKDFLIEGLFAANELDLNAIDKNGTTSLIQAVSAKQNDEQIAKVKILLENKADIDAQSFDKLSSTGLRIAVIEDNLPIIELFIKYNVNPFVPYDHKRTIAQYVEKEYAKIIKNEKITADNPRESTHNNIIKLLKKHIDSFIEYRDKLNEETKRYFKSLENLKEILPPALSNIILNYIFSSETPEKTSKPPFENSPST